MQAVETAVNAMTAVTGGWGTSITGISGAVTYMANLQTPANNPFTSESAFVQHCMCSNAIALSDMCLPRASRVVCNFHPQPAPEGRSA
jgi:hypothetical protein